LRAFYAAAWRRRRAGLALEPLELIVSDVVAEHPEYQAALEGTHGLERDFVPELGEANPFLHMGMHVAVREQVSADRPAGTRRVYEAIAARVGSGHGAEHAMMECLGAALWAAQRAGRPPDEQAYLACLERLARG
jgi:hypothetical protein